MPLWTQYTIFHFYDMLSNNINVIGGGKEIMDIIQEARKRITKLSLGTKFTLDNLFTGIEWDNFEKNDRLLAGKSFFSLVKNGKVSNVESYGKTSANKQVYIKKL